MPLNTRNYIRIYAKDKDDRWWCMYIQLVTTGGGGHWRTKHSFTNRRLTSTDRWCMCIKGGRQRQVNAVVAFGPISWSDSDQLLQPKRLIGVAGGCPQLDTSDWLRASVCSPLACGCICCMWRCNACHHALVPQQVMQDISSFSYLINVNLFS